MLIVNESLTVYACLSVAVTSMSRAVISTGGVPENVLVEVSNVNQRVLTLSITVGPLVSVALNVNP